MKRKIKTILVPVDFSANTKLAVSKAIEFCPKGDIHSVIHLFHVQRTAPVDIPGLFRHFLFGYSQQQIASATKRIRNQLEILKHSILKDRNDIEVEYGVGFEDPVQECIIRKARDLSADLIVIGKKCYHSLFPFLNTVSPGKLAAVTAIPVLTARPVSINQEIKTIVVPVSDQFPMAKLELLNELRNSSRVQIRLVIFKEYGIPVTTSRQQLLDAFTTLKNQLLYTVNYDVLEGRNKVKSLLEYCDKIGADVLIVYPGPGNRPGSWRYHQVFDFLSSGSKTQILSISHN